MMSEMQEALQTFLEESRDLLQTMEDALLGLEGGSEDPDAVNAMFRAAHTIKGSAGMFDLGEIVGFTHVAESVLDKVRNGQLAISGELVTLLLSCRDHIGRLIEAVAQTGGVPEDISQSGEGLLVQLRALLGVEGAKPAGSSMVEAADQPLESSGERAIGSDHWHLSLRFGRDCLRNGMDPLSFIRYLATLGEVIHIETLTDALPPLDEFDPESCYLGFEIDLASTADKQTIEGVFDFVREDSRIRILPPRSRIEDYIQIIRDTPENVTRLGDILVAGGCLTRREVDLALAAQQKAQEEAQGGESVPPRLGEIVVREGMVHQPVVNAALDKQKQVEDKKAQERRLIKIEAAKLDQLINLVGELVIAGASANLLASRAGNTALAEAASVVSTLVESIRDSALELRMVQMGESFNRFPRVVRDVAKELGKEIELVISGAEAEMDRTMVEKIADPLMHLVRNAMDHGIEPREARLARGKPEKGTLSLNAYHDSGSIVIEVADDGGGLDRARIYQKAVERGLIEPGQTLTDPEIVNLVMAPGFSTAAAVSNLSGRGVGMDVVKRNIEALRGTVAIESVEGQGTMVQIRLPLTLAIIDGFQVEVNEASYVLPLDTVVECVELSPEEKLTDRHYLNLRGEVLPYLRLRELFNVGSGIPSRESVVVVQCLGRRAGLVVDELLGEFQTVIKPMSKIFSMLRGIGGSTILGSGEVALILDVPALVSLAIGREKGGFERDGARKMRYMQ